MFKAREITHPELGRQKLERFADLAKDYGIVERTPTLDGRMMIMILNPKPQTGSKKNAKAENKQDGSQAVQDLGDGQDSATEVAQQSPVPAQESEPKASA
jgi:translation initiation factor IF-3